MAVLKNRHKRNQRRLGRGQYPLLAPVTITATGSGSTASLTFSKPVVVSGALPLTVGTLTFVSQNIVSPTLTVVTMSAAVTGLAYALPAGTPNVRGFQGEENAALAGTFS